MLNYGNDNAGKTLVETMEKAIGEGVAVAEDQRMKADAEKRAHDAKMESVRDRVKKLKKDALVYLVPVVNFIHNSFIQPLVEAGILETATVDGGAPIKDLSELDLSSGYKSEYEQIFCNFDLLTKDVRQSGELSLSISAGLVGNYSQLSVEVNIPYVQQRRSADAFSFLLGVEMGKAGCFDLLDDVLLCHYVDDGVNPCAMTTMYDSDYHVRPDEMEVRVEGDVRCGSHKRTELIYTHKVPQDYKRNFEMKRFLLKEFMEQSIGAFLSSCSREDPCVFKNRKMPMGGPAAPVNS